MFALKHLDALDLTCAQSYAVPAPVAYFVQNSAGLPMAYVVQESAGTGGYWRENLTSLGELIMAKEISDASKTNILITVKTMLSYFKAFLSSPTDEHIDEILSELMKLKQSIKRATKKNQNGLDSESLKDDDVKMFCGHLTAFLRSDLIPTIGTNFPADQLHLENFSNAIAAIITERNNSMLDCMHSVVQCMRFYVDNRGSASTTGKRSLPAFDVGPERANSSLTKTQPKAAETTQDVSIENPLQSGARAATKIVVFVKDKNGETTSKTLDFHKMISTASSNLELSVSELLQEFGANTDGFAKENEIIKCVENKQYKCHKYKLFHTEKTRFFFNDSRPQDEITDKEATLADISRINPQTYKTTRDDNICEFAIVFDLTNHASVQEQDPAKGIQYATRVLVYVGKTENRQIDRIQHMIKFEKNATVNDVVQKFAGKLQGNEIPEWEYLYLNGNISLYKRQFEYDEFRPPNYRDVQVHDLEHELVDFNNGRTVMTMKQVQELNSNAYKNCKGNSSANFAIEIRLNTSPEEKHIRSNDKWPTEIQSIIRGLSNEKKLQLQDLTDETITEIKKFPETMQMLFRKFTNASAKECRKINEYFMKNLTDIRGQFPSLGLDKSSSDSDSDEDEDED